MKFILIVTIVFTSYVAKSQGLKYEVVSYQNCIYNLATDSLEDCKFMQGEKPSLFEIITEKNVLKQYAANKIKTFEIKKIFWYFSSTDYVIKDDHGLTWLYQVEDGEDGSFFTMLVWSCNEKGEPIYFNKKASVGKWLIMFPVL